MLNHREFINSGRRWELIEQIRKEFKMTTKRINKIEEGIWVFNKSVNGNEVARYTIFNVPNEKEICYRLVNEGLLGLGQAAVVIRNKLPNREMRIEWNELFSTIAAGNSKKGEREAFIKMSLGYLLIAKKAKKKWEQVKGDLSDMGVPFDIIEELEDEY